MLFMGEEWASSSPFQFFSSHPEPELARATAEGRKNEFAEHGWDADAIPDPQDPATFERSKLNWDEIGDGDHARLHMFYRALISLRHNESDLSDPWLDHLRVTYDEERRWFVMHRGALSIVCNLSERPVEVPVVGDVVLAWGEPAVGDGATRLGAHSVVVLRAVN
jgi:maltooligosyltrehalose trehalohydrolase